MANDKTPNYHWDIPNPYGLQIVEMIKVASTFGAIDSRFKAFEDAYQNHKHSFEQITQRPKTLSGYGITDALPLTGGILTGSLSLNSSLYVIGDGNRHLWLRKLDGTPQGLVYSDANTGSMHFRTYSEDGSTYVNIGLSRDGKVMLPAYTPTSDYHAVTKKYADDQAAETVQVTTVQNFTLAQKSRARQNIDALGAVDRGAPNGVASLDAGGKIPSSQMPPVAITDTSVVNSQAAMLALVAERGDVAVRTDLNKSFILRLEPASVLANWQEILTPTDAVLSVNGKTGSVTVTKDDVNLGNVANKSEDQMASSGAIAAALNGKLPVGGRAADSSKLDGKTIAQLWYAMGGNELLRGNGYAKLPSGFIIQWGRDSLAADTSTALPIRFPNACASKLATVETGYVSDMTIAVTVEDVSNPASIILRMRTVYNGGYVGPPGAAQIVNWIAIGW